MKFVNSVYEHHFSGIEELWMTVTVAASSTLFSIFAGYNRPYCSSLVSHTMRICLIVVCSCAIFVMQFCYAFYDLIGALFCRYDVENWMQ